MAVPHDRYFHSWMSLNKHVGSMAVKSLAFLSMTQKVIEKFTLTVVFLKVRDADKFPLTATVTYRLYFLYLL